ncbi:MAG: YeeE/YedE thiosulfate transporter family protein, partial [Crocinitomicaceae bacterium]
MRQLILLGFGFAFGLILILSGATSWQVINEMFRFQSFQMYGIISTAILTVVTGLLLFKRLRAKDANQLSLNLDRKPLNFSKNALGGLTFGLGWGITGACTAPLF